MAKVEVLIIESERGWGQKTDEVKEFDNIKEAKEFIEKYNSQNNGDTAPDWYMYATLKT